MPKISPLSVVDTKAQLAHDVEIGPFCMVGPDVTLGNGCRLIAHATVLGHTTVGQHNIFYPNCVVGAPPQDLKYKGGPTRLVIGDHNEFREASTLHTGTEVGGGLTKVGSHNKFMVNAHIGHDAIIGDRCIIANNVMLAGHVVLGNNVWLSAGAAAHHFVRISDVVFIAAYSRIHHDVPPYVKLQDDIVRDTNSIGLQRAGYSPEDIVAIDDAIRRLFLSRRKTFADVMSEFEGMNGEMNPHVKRLVSFLRERDLGKHGRYLESFRRK